MNSQYFEGLTLKIDQVVAYLDSKSDVEIGTIFSKEINFNIQIDIENFGIQKKKFFKIIKSRDKYLSQIIRSLSHQEREFFYDISKDTQDEMRKHLRTISHYIDDLSSLFDSGGSIGNLFDIDQSFINSYEAFTVFARITKTSLDILNRKILDDLNPSFNAKNNQVDELISDLNLYKGEASSRKTKEIYKKKYKDYKRTVEVYELYLMLLVCLSVTLIVGQLFAHNFFDSLNVSNALMIKLTILALIATLFTYCFKQIGFYRKISEQAHQTFMELEALPEYLVHLPKVKQDEIRADLAKCYFGQNLFDSIKEDSVSIQEQSKANTEVLKSTAALLEVIKKQNSSPN